MQPRNTSMSQPLSVQHSCSTSLVFRSHYLPGFCNRYHYHSSLWASRFALCQEPGCPDAQWEDGGFPRERWRTLHGNYWVTVWTNDWAPGEGTQAALGAQLKAIHPCDWKVPPLHEPRLRAGCHRGRFSTWRSLLLEIFSEPWDR